MGNNIPRPKNVNEKNKDEDKKQIKKHETSH